MFAIRINDTFLDLDPKAALRYTLNNPLFDPDSVGRSFNFPLTIPLTSRNRSVLDFPERLDHARSSYEYTGAVLYIMHLPFEVGRATVTGTDPDYAEIVLQNIERDFLNQLKDILVHEQLETVSTNLNPPTAQWTIQLDPPPDQYQININATVYLWTVTQGSDMNDIINHFVTEINDDYPGMATGNAGLAQLYLDSALVEQNPVTYLQNMEVATIVTEATSNMTGFQNHVDDVNQNPVGTHCFPVFNWPGFYAGNNPAYSGRINFWFDGATIDNQPYSSRQWETTYIPFVYLHYALSRLLLQVDGIDAFGGAFWNDTDFQETVLFNNLAVDEVSLNQYYPDQLYLNKFKETIDLNRHVPEMDGIELLQNALEFFQLYIREEDGVIYLFEKKDQLQSTPLDWTGKVGNNSSQATQEQEGFQLDYDRDTNDTGTQPGQLAPYNQGAQKTKIKTRFSTVYTTDVSPEGQANSRLAHVVAKGSSDEGGLGNTTYKPRLFFFRGLQDNANNVQYPYGTHSDIDVNSNTVGNRSLDWNTAITGLYAKSWAGIPELNEGNQVTVEVALTINDLLQIRKWERPRVRFYTPEGEFTGIIKQISISVTQAGLGLSTVTLIKQQ